ncbi:hypothetical protein ACIP6P_09785, partial [Streptomyces sp. NPDC088729]
MLISAALSVGSGVLPRLEELLSVTGLREENRELRRRQDRMISDLNDTRGELRQLLELADTLRPLAELQRPADEPDTGAPTP